VFFLGGVGFDRLGGGALRFRPPGGGGRFVLLGSLCVIGVAGALIFEAVLGFPPGTGGLEESPLGEGAGRDVVFLGDEAGGFGRDDEAGGFGRGDDEGFFDFSTVANERGDGVAFSRFEASVVRGDFTVVSGSNALEVFEFFMASKFSLTLVAILTCGVYASAPCGTNRVPLN